MRNAILAFVLAIGASVAVGGQGASTVDWNQWRGPNRTGISPETGLLREWPPAGPSAIWTASNLGGGYGSISMSGDRVFVQGLRTRQSIITVLNRADGKHLWSKVLGGSGDGGGQGPGPRATPTVDGDRVYVLSENGDLACLRVADGTSVWQRNILRDFGGRQIPWEISESPLVDGDRVIVTPGGRGAGMVALDKMTGRTLWVAKELSDEAGYSSVIAADIQGVRTYMTLTSQAGVGVRASDGKLMWREQSPANNTANITTPVYADNKVFYSSNYGTGGALFSLTASGGEVRSQQVYFTREMQNHHGGIVLVNGTLFGYNNSILTALDFASGKMLWRHRSVGKGAVSYADGHLYILSEDNVVGLVEATPTAYREKGRFTIRDQGWPSWAHPVISGGRLYLRNQGVLTAYDIRAR
jgi:outer membrane protein assembly factor BamB